MLSVKATSGHANGYQSFAPKHGSMQSFCRGVVHLGLLSKPVLLCELENLPKCPPTFSLLLFYSTSSIEARNI